MEFLNSNESTHMIKVVGVGGGGSNAVNHMFREGITGVDFIICNTDNQALAMSPVPTKVQLGPSLTEGRGAGSLPNIGKEACIESSEEIARLLGYGTKMLFITAGMGGGTGTGAAPIIAKTAREMGILTVGIVTLPFSFEGKRRLNQAAEGLEQLKQNVDTLIVIANERLREIYGDLPLRGAFAHADNILTTAAKAIAEIITVAGHINVDFADVNTVMRDSGVAIMGVGVAEGESRAKIAIDQALNSPLLEDNNIEGAQHILINISSGTSEVTMDEIMEITSYVQAEAGEGTDVIWGNCYNEELGTKLSVTIIATGFQRRGAGKRIDDGKIVVNLDQENKQQIGAQRTGLDTVTLDEAHYKSGHVVDFEVRPNITNPQEVRAAGTAHPKRPVTPLPKISNPKVVHDLENTPAYIRRGIMLEDVAHSSEEVYSRVSVHAEGEYDLFSSVPYLNEKDGID